MAAVYRDFVFKSTCEIYNSFWQFLDSGKMKRSLHRYIANTTFGVVESSWNVMAQSDALDGGSEGETGEWSG
jgi:hypothetical protein